ncbi:uncharacterized protein PV06_05845 [Exophiala oligosperma]|uniref:DUF7730 domain-containing protein n=2 Tax=Chaetothyriales TaxID=34395 RepID=A0A0D2BXN9_9EURO|nr:uncharacterized protein PV06_05845 [Exophiala oligosperma]KAJ9635747.1 hypothetical protein H2204_005707 [Knufia peltigerae]KIW42282.1 hypothetical protein PV06_05845 [Exophiala oligosperma]
MTSPRKTRRPVQPRPKQPAYINPLHRQTTTTIRPYVPSRRQQPPINANSPLATQNTLPDKPAKPFPFFKLPGEIRNKIYSLVVPNTLVIVSSNHPQKEYNQLKAQKLPGEQVKCPRLRLFGQFQGQNTPVAMLFTCRQMYQELRQLIYSRTTFCFDRFVVINKFLNRVQKASATSIERLEVIHKGYSEPELMADREWKSRHDARWAAMLKRVKAELTGLRRLKLDLTIYDWPCSLDITEGWARPLLDLASDGLERVEILLEHDRFHKMKCAGVARELESKMMTPKGRKMKVQEARAEDKRKAKKILTITFPLNNRITSNNVPVPKMAKRTGLSEYAQAQPLVATCGIPMW